jgi:hypothetical protein
VQYATRREAAARHVAGGAWGRRRTVDVHHVKERSMGTTAGGVTNTGDVQKQADDLTKTQLELTKINFQVQQSTATFETSNAVTAQEGTANAQVAQHLSSAGRA